MLSAFIDYLDAGGSRVYSPKPFVLLCGGPRTSVGEAIPASLRDAFLKSNFIATIKNAEVHQIEEIQDYFEKDSPYKDLVSFERNIAELSDLVLLFPESPGSFTELGVFSSFKEISEKTLVVIQQKYLSKSSFIAKGPVAYLSAISGRAIFSITNDSVGIRGNSYAGVKPDKVLQLLKLPIEARLEEAKNRTTFQKNSFSHRCKLYVAFLKEFSVLKDDEIVKLFSIFGISITPPLLNKIAFCCKCIFWSKTAQMGFDRIHFALDGNEAAYLNFSGGMSDKLRRRLNIRKHWETFEPQRLEAQREALLP